MEAEILDLIDNTSVIATESCHLVMESYFSYIEKEMMIYTESSNTNGSFGVKLIEGLKKIFKAIVGFIGKMIEKIKGLFTKHKNRPMVNDIAASVVGTDAVSEYAVVQEGTQHGPDYLTQHGQTPESVADGIYLQILNKDVIRVNCGWGKQINRPDITGNKDLERVNNFNYKHADLVPDVIHMVTHLDLLRDLHEKLSKYISELNDTDPSSNTYKFHQFVLNKHLKPLKDSYYALDEAKRGWKTPRSVDLKISDFMEMQSIISKMTVETEKILYKDYDKDFYKQYFGIIGNISHEFIRFQMGLNAFSVKLDFDINFIAPQYRNKIKDPEKLAKFVKGCIDNGVTPKYLAYNTWLIANKKLKGDKKEFNPVKGQSRFILFPEDDRIVYKIAMSGFGQSSNNNEAIVTDLVKKHPDLKSYFALIVNNYEDGALAVQERVVNNLMNQGLSDEVFSNSLNVLYDKSQSTQDIEEDIGIIQRELGIKSPIGLEDLHSGNKTMDTNRGHLVLLDYGMLAPNCDVFNIQQMSSEEYNLLKDSRRKNKDYKAGLISKDEYESWKSDADKKAWELRGPQARNTFDLINKRNEFVDKIQNETDPEKIHKLKKQANRYQEEIHRRNSDADSHVHGFTATNSKESDTK